MLNLVGVQYLLGPQHWTSTIFQLGWGALKSPATYCDKQRERGSPRSQKRPQRDGPRNRSKESESGAIFEGKKLCLNIFYVSFQGPRTVALVENVGSGLEAASPGFQV